MDIVIEIIIFFLVMFVYHVKERFGAKWTLELQVNVSINN